MVPVVALSCHCGVGSVVVILGNGRASLLYLTLPLVFPPESGGPPESHSSPGKVQDSSYSPSGLWWDCFPTPVPFDSSGNPVGIPTLFRRHVPDLISHVTSRLDFMQKVNTFL